MACCWGQPELAIVFMPCLNVTRFLKEFDVNSIIDMQREVCKRFGATHYASDENNTVYFAGETQGLLPVHGERVRGGENQSGWYVWCGGNRFDRDDFFQEMSVFEFAGRVPLAYSFLGLPPGFKFLVAGGHQRAWLEEGLLEEGLLENNTDQESK